MLQAFLHALLGVVAEVDHCLQQRQMTGIAEMALCEARQRIDPLWCRRPAVAT